MNKFVLTFFLGLLSTSVLAHHAFTTHYNPRESMQLEGRVTEFTIQSPHSRIVLDVTGDDGSLQSWEVETTAAAHLRRMGVENDTFEIGDQIRVIAWPNRRPDNPLVYGLGFITEEGQRYGQLPDLKVESYAAQNASGAAAIAGRWEAPIPDRSLQSTLPLNEAGLLARDNYDPQKSPANFCEPSSIPSLLYAPFLSDIQINENEVVFTHEAYGIERRIPLNADSAQVESTGVFGSASAQIDGDALIVESGDYPESAWGLAIATHITGGETDIPSSTQKRVTERYSLSEDGLQLLVEYSLYDPAYLTETYHTSMFWHRVADNEPIYGYECDVQSAERFSGNQD